MKIKRCASDVAGFTQSSQGIGRFQLFQFVDRVRGFSIVSLLISVTVHPGQTQLTRTLFFAYLSAKLGSTP